MKLTNKQQDAVRKLWQLDVPQRDRILAEVERTLMANEIALRTGKLKRVRPVGDHRIVKAYGHVPPWKPGRRKDQE